MVVIYLNKTLLLVIRDKHPEGHRNIDTLDIVRYKRKSMTHLIFMLTL